MAKIGNSKLKSVLESIQFAQDALQESLLGQPDPADGTVVVIGDRKVSRSINQLDTAKSTLEVFLLPEEPPPPPPPPEPPPPEPPPPPPPPPVEPEFPDATNTGVPAGTILTPSSGTLETSHDGQIIEGLDHRGEIVIKHSNVVVRKNRVNGQGSWCVVLVLGNVENYLIEDNEIIGNNPTNGAKGIIIRTTSANSKAIIRRNNIHHVEDGIYVDGGSHGGIAHDNYIHDLAAGSVDPHHDCLQVNASNWIFEHNHLHHLNASAGITHGPCTNVTINNNLFIGGAYIIRVERAGSSGFKITNNRLADYNFGYWSLEGAVNPVIYGNVDHHTGTLIPGQQPIPIIG